MPEAPASRGRPAVHSGGAVAAEETEALTAEESDAVQVDWTAGEAAAAAAAVVAADRDQARALRDALTAALRENEGQDALDALQIQIDALYQVCRELRDAVEAGRIGPGLSIDAPLFDAAEAKIAGARAP